MPRIITEGKIEDYKQSMPAVYWRRNRKSTISLLHDTPFAMDRQLEDQRLQIEKNRNPQLTVPTKVDKVRSLQITAKKGVSRPEAIKANVLNKIVREASGIHTYAIIPPPREKMDGEKKSFDIDPDPETNPAMRPYAMEAKMKPVLCSFGHRPRSASRTFHPATMKFRLKHGEIASNLDSNKTGVGLPVATLAKVLKAPKILSTEDMLDESKVSTEFDASTTELRSELFFSETEKEMMFSTQYSLSSKPRKGSKKSSTSYGGLSDASHEQNDDDHTWISSSIGMKPHNKTRVKLSPVNYFLYHTVNILFLFIFI